LWGVCCFPTARWAKQAHVTGLADEGELFMISFTGSHCIWAMLMYARRFFCVMPPLWVGVRMGVRSFVLRSGYGYQPRRVVEICCVLSEGKDRAKSIPKADQGNVNGGGSTRLPSSTMHISPELNSGEADQRRLLLLRMPLRF